LNDIETFLGTAKEYQLLNPKEFHNQFESILTLDVKVMFLGYFDPVVGKGEREERDFTCCLKQSLQDILSRVC
jgi:hypothetical protein